MAHPKSLTGCSDIKKNLETTKLFQFKYDIHKENIQIEEWTNKISTAGETYSNIARQQFNLYSTSSCLIFRDYMYTRRSEWFEEKEFSLALKKCNKLLTSGRWYTIKQNMETTDMFQVRYDTHKEMV